MKDKNQIRLIEAVKQVQRKYLRAKHRKWTFRLDGRSQTKLTSKRWHK